MDEKRQIDALLPNDSAIRARRGALEGELIRTAPSRRRRRRSARVAIALAALVAIGTGAAWAAGVFSASEISFQAGVGCYSEARLQGSRLSITIFHAAADPVAKCEKYWREGVVDTTLRRLGREGKIDYPRGRYPPRLVACANEGSGIAVFPGPDGVCEKLGLKPLPADYSAAGREAARAYTGWSRVLSDLQVVKPGDCRSPQSLAQEARKRLSKSPYSDLRVVIERGGGPCGEGVESRGRVIEVGTVTRHEDEVSGVADQAFDALSGLIERAHLECIAPEKFGAFARGDLGRAGLGQVRVGVSQRFWPCADGTGFNPERLRVEFGASPYKVWRSNRAGFLRNR